MFNEKEVCQNIIDAACALEWPRSRVMIQVLDDSTCEETRRRIEDKVFEWKEKGVNIVYRWRSNRSGYKAGAMHEAMTDIENYEMCAIFDADFDPSPAGKARPFTPPTVVKPSVTFQVYLSSIPSQLTSASPFTPRLHYYTTVNNPCVERIHERLIGRHERIHERDWTTHPGPGTFCTKPSLTCAVTPVRQGRPLSHTSQLFISRPPRPSLSTSFQVSLTTIV